MIYIKQCRKVFVYVCLISFASLDLLGINFQLVLIHVGPGRVPGGRGAPQSTTNVYDEHVYFLFVDPYPQARKDSSPKS